MRLIKRVKPLVLPASVLFLAACGNSNDGGGSSGGSTGGTSSLASPQAAEASAAYITQLSSLASTVPTSAPPTGTAAGVKAELATNNPTTVNCGTSGTFTVSSSTGTGNSTDETVVFNACVNGSTTENGQFVSSETSASPVTTIDLTYGSGGTPLSITETTPAVDLSFSGSLSLANNSSTGDSTGTFNDFSATIANSSASKSIEAVFGGSAPLVLGTTSTQQSRSVTINGPVAVNTTGLGTNCPSIGGTFDTKSPITVTKSGNTDVATSGDLLITDAQNNSVEIVITNGQYTVSINGGAPTAFTPSTLSTLCDPAAAGG